MIGKLTGSTEDAGKGMVILETVSGVGYLVGVSSTTKNKILSEKSCTIFTHTILRKDTIELFGFLNREEYSIFLLLITVSGIGPKTATGILETVPIPTLMTAIQKEDVATLVTYGVGKKQAQRIVLELQKKVEIKDQEMHVGGDVTAALIALGYSKKEIMETLKNVKIKEGGVDEQIQEVLRSMRNSQIGRHNA